MKKTCFQFLFNRVYSSVVRDYQTLGLYLEPFISCKTDSFVVDVDDELGDKWRVTFSAGTSCPSIETYSIRFCCTKYSTWFGDNDFTTSLCALGVANFRNFRRLKFLYNLFPSLRSCLYSRYSRLCSSARYFDLFCAKSYDDDGGLL